MHADPAELVRVTRGRIHDVLVDVMAGVEDIPGVGPKKRARLLQRFGGVRGVTNASVDDLIGMAQTLRGLGSSGVTFVTVPTAL